MRSSLSAAFVQAPLTVSAFSCIQSTRPARWYCTATSSAKQSMKSPSSPRSYRLAPSDFAFLWEECKRCFYLKVHGQLYRPRAPFPTIFGAIDVAMKRHFRGLRTTDLIPEMPAGTFLCEERDAWVESKPITPQNHTDSIFIRGMVCLYQRRVFYLAISSLIIWPILTFY